MAARISGAPENVVNGFGEIGRDILSELTKLESARARNENANQYFDLGSKPTLASPSAAPQFNAPSNASYLDMMGQMEAAPKKPLIDQEELNRRSWDGVDLKDAATQSAFNRWYDSKPLELPMSEAERTERRRADEARQRQDLYDSMPADLQSFLRQVGADPNNYVTPEERAEYEAAQEARQQVQERQDRVERKTADRTVYDRGGSPAGRATGPTFFYDQQGNVTNIPGDNAQMRYAYRPRAFTVDDEGNVTEMRAEPPKPQLLLPGFISKRLYQLVRSNENGNGKHKGKDKKKSDYDLIEESIKAQADIESLFPNAANTAPNTDRNFEQDYYEGRRDVGRYDAEVKTERQKAIDDAIETQRAWFAQAYVHVKSEHIDANGQFRFDPNTEAAIDAFMNDMHLDPTEEWIMWSYVSRYLGYTPDNNGKFLGADKNQIPDELLISALNGMGMSMYMYGHPFHYFDNGLEYGGTKCFPLGVITPDEAEVFCRQGGVLQDVDPMELISRARNDFVNNTMPKARAEAHKTGNMSQYYVLENAARALCSLSNISTRYYNMAESIDRGYDELVNDFDKNINPEKDEAVCDEMKRRTLAQQARRDRAGAALDKRRNRTKRVYAADVLDDQGNIIHRKGDKVKKGDDLTNALVTEIRNSKVSPFDATCTYLANQAKFMGVIGFAPIVASGYVEHAVGNIYTKVSNTALHGLYGVLFDNPNIDSVDDYAVTEAMYNYIGTDAAVEAITAWKALLRVGGQDAVTMFWSRYKHLTRENVSKFLKEDVNQESLFTGRFAEKAKEIGAKANDVMQLLLPGDIGFRKQDAKRWLEAFMVNNMFVAASGDMRERSFTSSEVLEMIESMGVDGFLAAATDTISGRDAMIMTRNQTLARESPLTHIADSILRKSGLTNMLVTLGIDTYFTYGLNLIQNMIPFSNTVSFLAVRGINVIATGGAFDVNNADNLDILNYQMGGMDEFGQGLAKNLMYDFVKFGNVGVFGLLMGFILMGIGFDEPEDERAKYCWEEYRIGRKIGLGGVDENGNPQGIPLFRAWWLDDLMLFGAPLAYAVAACSIEQKLGDNDPNLPAELFFGGCYDVVSGASLLDLSRSIRSARETVATLDDMMSNPDAVAGSNWYSYAWMEFVELPVARAANKLFMPNFARDMFKDEFDHTPYYVYDRSSETPGKTKYNDDVEDQMRRTECRYNPVYALFCNMWLNGYFFDDGSTQKTGYLLREMPIATMKDQLQMTWAEGFDYHPEQFEDEEERAIYIDQKCEQLIDWFDELGPLDSDSTVTKALANGAWIEPGLRIELIKYCKRRQNYAENVYNLAVQQGISGAEKNNAYTMKTNAWYYYDSILQNICYNNEIPWTCASYAKLRSDTEVLYYDKYTGKPLPVLFALFNDNAEKRYEPKGNKPNQMALFTTPRTGEDYGYNYETKPVWLNADTDLEGIFEDSEGKVVPRGKDEGIYLNTAIFGGTPNYQTVDEDGNIVQLESPGYNALDNPTVGHRAYVPFEESMLFDLPNINVDALVNKVNEGTSKEKSGNGSGGASGAGGSGSGKEAVLDDMYYGSWNDVMDLFKSIDRKDLDGGTLGDMGLYYDKDHWQTNYSPTWYSGSSMWYGGGGGGYSRSSSYTPKIYSTSRSANPDRGSTMYAKTPTNSPNTDYLRPGFSTKGSREAYKRQDI